MATLNSIADDVYVITNRPDLVVETQVAIRKAIRKFHGAETFNRDLTIKQVDMTVLTPDAPGQYRWTIPLTTFDKFRRFHGVNYPPDRKIPLNTTPAPLIDVSSAFNPIREFVQVAANNLFDGYGYERSSYFMLVGNTVTVKANWYVDYLNFLFFQWPTIPADVTNPIVSWIADEYSDAIVEEASGMIFKMIGKDDEYQRFQGLFAENLAILKATDIGLAG